MMISQKKIFEYCQVPILLNPLQLFEATTLWCSLRICKIKICHLRFGIALLIGRNFLIFWFISCVWDYLTRSFILSKIYSWLVLGEIFLVLEKSTMFIIGVLKSGLFLQITENLGARLILSGIINLIIPHINFRDFWHNQLINILFENWGAKLFQIEGGQCILCRSIISYHFFTCVKYVDFENRGAIWGSYD